MVVGTTGDGARRAGWAIVGAKETARRRSARGVPTLGPAVEAAGGPEGIVRTVPATSRRRGHPVGSDVRMTGFSQPGRVRLTTYSERTYHAE
jgi:hypothetical protein